MRRNKITNLTRHLVPAIGTWLKKKTQNKKKTLGFETQQLLKVWVHIHKNNFCRCTTTEPTEGRNQQLCINKILGTFSAACGSIVWFFFEIIKHTNPHVLNNFRCVFAPLWNDSPSDPVDLLLNLFSSSELIQLNTIVQQTIKPLFFHLFPSFLHSSIMPLSRTQ